MTTRLQLLSRWRRIVGCAVAGYGLALSLASVAAPESETGQNFLVHNWDYDEGLPSTCVNSVIRTPDGYVWLATRHGLSRFDGIRFVTFNTANTPAIKDNRISSVATGQPGIFWMGTDIGTLSRCDHGTFADVDLRTATQGRRINAIVADAEGSLWLGTGGAGLLQLKNGRIETFTITNGLASLNILQLLADQQGRIWYLADSGRLGWIERGKCHVPDNTGAVPTSIQAIALSQDGGLWLATQKEKNAGTGIFKLKGGLAKEEIQSPLLPQSPYWRTRAGALLEDQTGKLWCGTSGEGVFFRDTSGQWKKLAADLPFAHAETVCLLADEGDSVWIGTRTSGLHQAVPNPVAAFHLPPDYNQYALRTTCVRHDASVWGGTDGGGLFRWNAAGVLRFGVPSGLGGTQVNALWEDSRSNFWAGTSTGLFQFRAGQFEPAINAAGRADVTTLYEDPQGKMWAGTMSGLFCESDAERKFDQRHGLPGGRILAITQDRQHRFWVGIQGVGVFRQNGDRFERWKPQGGVMDARQRWSDGVRVRDVLANEDGSLWVATFGDGLYLLDGDHIRKWSWESDGLPSNHLFALLEDNAGNLWVSSENGIFGCSQKALLDYQPGGSRPIPWRLTQANGLPNKVCSGGGHPVATKSADGRLVFPDSSALVVFDPATLPRETQTWTPIIEEVRVDGQPLLLSSSQPIRVISGARSYEFDFTSPNILTPTRLRFRYRLEGLDKDWVAEGTLRSARYNRLPPGNYTFRVMACNNYGVWNENEASLPLTIVPRLWEAKWFQLSLGLCLLGSVGFVARQVESARNRRKVAALEHDRALERERTRIARDIHDDLGASLTEVALLGDMAGDKKTSPEELRTQTRQISTAARKMAQSLEAIVWAVRPENDSLRSLIEYMSRRTDELFEKMPRQYQFIVPAQIPECSIHAEARHNVFLACKEALTNSLKYAHASMVRVELTCDPCQCQIKITDNGKGFAAEDIRPGGTGLRNMRQRMEEIGGGFELESQPGHGTVVRLEFPLPPPSLK